MAIIVPNSPSPLRFRLDFPPSANVYWRHDRGVTHRSYQAVSYIAGVQRDLMLLYRGRIPNLSSFRQLTFSSVLYFPYPVKGDLSNRVKVLEDAVAQAFGIDDTVFHAHYHVRRYYKSRERGAHSLACALVKISPFTDTGESAVLYEGVVA